MARHRSDRRPHDSGVLDYLDPLGILDIFGGDNPFVAIVVVLAVIAIVVLAWFFLVPVLLALLDAVILIALALAGVIGHVLLHRPWEIEASARERAVTWKVVGWRRSGQVINSAARHLSDGRPLPAEVGELLAR
ncbi:MAG: hypothetical protein M3083_16265 [Actinomycetota bacterium]|nr:hypothetical protein [Actinomycetota bacterium]MDQ6949312.1 hypothetical protein [Actinomycetota bacterium]